MQQHATLGNKLNLTSSNMKNYNNIYAHIYFISKIQEIISSEPKFLVFISVIDDTIPCLDLLLQIQPECVG